MCCILDANFEKAESVADTTWRHLSLPNQNKLLDFLKKYEDLFDSTLGDQNIEPVSFTLKKDVKPHHDRAYPAPTAHKEAIIKDLSRLCKLGVPEWQPALEWTSPSFIVPKKIKLCVFLVMLKK